MISRIIKAEVRRVINRRHRQITLTETLIILDITKTELFYYTLNEKNGSHVLASSLTGSNKAHELDMITWDLECP